MSYYIQPDIRLGRIRLLYRCFRFGFKSFLSGDWDFTKNAIHSVLLILIKSFKDQFSETKSCVICGWRGAGFYPNVGSGYFEKATICPSCFSQDRHRSLAVILAQKSKAFENNSVVIEVAPMRSFQKYCLETKKYQNYISFDYSRFAMERGDITEMRFENAYCDYFLCMHVLEHIANEKKALVEILRVLKPGGILVIQVPIDKNITSTIEYEEPNPKETYHVRRYGFDFSTRLSSMGFDVQKVNIMELLGNNEIFAGGYDKEDIYFARKIED